MIKYVAFLFSILFSVSAYGASPTLFFSDLLSGPATGLGDGVGSGVIVTVWGTNLGSSQGTSTIQVGGIPAAYVYYWKPADGTLPGGPAELFKYQQMQEISFSVPASAVSGANTISVTVGSVTSNSLSFTVRTGGIFYVKGTGSNSNPGTWSQPWLTMAYAVDHAGLAAGSTIYVAGNLTEQPIVGNFFKPLDGTSGNEIAFVAYPGFHVIATTSNVGQPAFWNYDYTSHNRYWVISKISAIGVNSAMDTGGNWREVGIEQTQTNGTCMNSNSGMMNNGNSKGARIAGFVLYGNYLHDIGCATLTNNQAHVIYFTYEATAPSNLNATLNSGSTSAILYFSGSPNNVNYLVDDLLTIAGAGVSGGLFTGTITAVNYSTGSVTWTPATSTTVSSGTNVDNSVYSYTPYDLGWNHIENNTPFVAFQLYNENYCGGFNGTAKVHDNFIKDQQADWIGIVGDCRTNYGIPNTSTWDVYNNIAVNTGKYFSGEQAFNPAGNYTQAIVIRAPSGYGCGATCFQPVINFYNNTTYAYGDSVVNVGSCAYIDGVSSATLNFKNNICVDTLNFPFLTAGSTGVPTSHTNNLWYSSFGQPAPSWDTSPLNVDPKFTNPGVSDFSLQSTSPAKDAGYNTAPIVATDILGITRPQGSAYDIGAFELVTGLSVSPASVVTMSGFQGGPFSGQPVSYTLTNTEGNTINWSAAVTQNWTTLSATTGSISGTNQNPSASSTVTVSSNANTNLLNPGSFGDTLTFLNTTDGNGTTTRAITVQVSSLGGGNTPGNRVPVTRTPTKRTAR